MANQPWRRGHRLLYALAVTVALASCQTVTDPSPMPTASTLPPDAQVLTGTWIGSYRITRAEPASCGAAFGCPVGSLNLGLTLTEGAGGVTGMLAAGEGSGQVPVTGILTAGRHLQLTSAPLPVLFSCTGGFSRSGHTQLVSWSTTYSGKQLIGTFTVDIFRFAQGGTNLCPAYTQRLWAESVQLTRDSTVD